MLTRTKTSIKCELGEKKDNFCKKRPANLIIKEQREKGLNATLHNTSIITHTHIVERSDHGEEKDKRGERDRERERGKR